ncbi:MAG: GntR family transcriptional regulator [Firmicutes bacterium]|nr:GntR family transcriptional regulator [Bacillota bacterium]MDH7496227.1 GntR family transcriptional regulator [Bacillota bacterium]
MRVKKGFKPLRVQLYERLLEMIRCGRLPFGSKLPSEPELASLLKVSRNVLRETLLLMEQDGIVVNQRGIGRTVLGPAKAPPGTDVSRFVDTVDFLGARGDRVDCSVIAAYDQEAGSVAKDRLHLSEGERVLVLQIRAEVTGVPVAYMVDFVPIRVVPFVLERVRRNAPDSAVRLLASAGVTVARSEVEASAVHLGETDARNARVPADTPALLIERVAYDTSDKAVVYSRHYLLPHAPKLRFVATWQGSR